MKGSSLVLMSGLISFLGCASPTTEPSPPSEPGKPPAGGGLGEAQDPGQRSSLVAQHLSNARDYIASGRYREAEASVNEALVLDPENVLAKRLLGDIAALRGRGGQEMGQSYGAEMQRRWEVQVQSLRAEALESLDRGRAYLAERRYDEAIQEFHIVLNHIKWSPIRGDWASVEAEATALLAQAEETRKAERDATRRAKEGETFAKLKEAEAQEASRRTEMVRTMISQAIDAYDLGSFDECVEICDRALQLDPRSSEARELRESAFKSARDKNRTDYIQKKREEFRRWREDIAETRIPYTDFITLPDREYWEEITRKRARRGASSFSTSETEDTRRLRELIRTTTVPSLNVKDEAELNTVIGILHTYTGLPFIVDPAASDAVRSASIVFNLPIENPITVKDALEIIVEVAGAQIAYLFKHDSILITTAEKAKGKSVVRNHDIQDLVFTLTDFVGPNLGMLAEATSGRGDRDGGSPFGGIGQEPKQIVNPEELSALLKETVAPGTWDQEGHRLEPFNGNLIVVHTEDVQRQIENFLADLRRFSAAIVTIETKFLTVSENFLQEIGVEFRGLGGEGWARSRTWTTSRTASSRPAPTTTARSGSTTAEAASPPAWERPRAPPRAPSSRRRRTTSGPGAKGSSTARSAAPCRARAGRHSRSRSWTIRNSTCWSEWWRNPPNSGS